MKSRIISKSEGETVDFAEQFIKEAIEKADAAKPLILWLEGELGAGKTQFVKGLARALGIKERITSPTFVLMKKFKIPLRLASLAQGKPPGKSLFFHLDFYRIYDSEDAKQLGIDKIIKNPKAILAIEWAERIADSIPRPYWEIKFEHMGGNERRVIIKYVSDSR